MQPPVQRLVQVGAGARAGDRAAHQDEHRDRQEREAVERPVQDVRHEAERVQPLGPDQKAHRDDAQAERDRCAGQQHGDGHRATITPNCSSLTTVRPRPRTPPGRWPGPGSGPGTATRAGPCRAAPRNTGSKGRPPDRLRVPVVGPGLIPEGDAIAGERGAEHQRDRCGDQRQRESPRGPGRPAGDRR